MIVTGQINMRPLVALALLVPWQATHAEYDASVATTLMSLNAAALCPAAKLRDWSCKRCNRTQFAHPSRDLMILTAEKGVIMHSNLLVMVGALHGSRTILVSRHVHFAWAREA